jgi:hypothetical protein
VSPELERVLAQLAATPPTLRAWLAGQGDAWLRADEGPETFSAYDVVGHLIHGERTDWMPRVERILAHGPARPFEPFDRFAMRRADQRRPIAELLDEFQALRGANLARLATLRMTAADLERVGAHPELGRVTLRELLATWVVHDLGHLGQIARVLAHQLRDEVGPWRAYLPVLTRRATGAPDERAPIRGASLLTCHPLESPVRP